MSLRNLLRGHQRVRDERRERQQKIELLDLQLKQTKLQDKQDQLQREAFLDLLGQLKPKAAVPAVPFKTTQEQEFGLPELQGNIAEAAVPAKPGQTILKALGTPEGQAAALQSGRINIQQLANIRGKQEPFGGALTGIPGLQFKSLTITEEGKKRAKFGLPELTTPMTIQEVTKFIDKSGNHPTTGTTPNQAIKQGFKEASIAEQNLALQQRGPLAVLNKMKELGADLFPEKTETGIRGLFQRGKQGVSNLANLITQDDPRVTEFQSIAKGATALLIRALGEKGTLNEGDVKRAIMLQPTLFNMFGIPDTKQVFDGKIKNIEQILNVIKSGGVEAGIAALNALDLGNTEISQEQIDAIIKESGVKLGKKKPSLKLGTVGQKNKVIDFSELPQ